MAARRPDPSELEAAVGRGVPDVVAPGLDILFCGINPSLWSAAVGHHFARPGNRFFKVLYGAGLTPRLLAPEEDRLLVSFGLGVTNLVARATATAAELGDDELSQGARRLARKTRRLRPEVVAVVGITAYRRAFRVPQAPLGEQDRRLGPARCFVLPNPSGLQARYQLEEMVALYGELARAVGRAPGVRPTR